MRWVAEVSKSGSRSKCSSSVMLKVDELARSRSRLGSSEPPSEEEEDEREEEGLPRWPLP